MLYERSKSAPSDAYEKATMSLLGQLQEFAKENNFDPASVSIQPDLGGHRLCFTFFGKNEKVKSEKVEGQLQFSNGHAYFEFSIENSETKDAFAANFTSFFITKL